MTLLLWGCISLWRMFRLRSTDHRNLLQIALLIYLEKVSLSRAIKSLIVIYVTQNKSFNDTWIISKISFYYFIEYAYAPIKWVSSTHLYINVDLYSKCEWRRDYALHFASTLCFRRCLLWMSLQLSPLRNRISRLSELQLRPPSQWILSDPHST